MSHGIYVHLPFCRTHCSYCAFAISTDGSLQEEYTQALLRECGGHAAALEIESIYFGGGTPSRMSIENLRRIATAVPGPRARDLEFSMESNPEDITADAIASWRELGVNRLSIGVQSFHNAESVNH